MILLTAHPRYKYRVAEDCEFLIGLRHINPPERECVLADKGRRLVTLTETRLVIHEGYQFDGATCALDFKRALPGCAVHDALLQMLYKYPDLFHEQVAHDAMMRVHKVHGFRLYRLYHYAVSGWPRKLYKWLGNKFKR